MAKVTFNVEVCKGCGLCISVCPKKIIELGSYINSKGYHSAAITDMNACIACASCARICPDCVIEVEK
ncbi:MAG: 4Fe-4S binding protein [Christensenellales bacterium]